MRQHKKILVTASCAAIALASHCIAPEFATATDYFWGGGGGDDNWGNFSNWSFGQIPPTAGFNTDVFMQGPGGTSDLADAFNNDANWSIDSITFSSTATGSWDLLGGQLNVASFITNDDGNVHSFSNDRVGLSLGALSINANSGDLDFDADLHFNLNNSEISVGGGNDVYFDGGVTAEGFITTATVSINGGTLLRIGAASTVVTEWEVFNGTLQTNAATTLGNNAHVDLIFNFTALDLNGFNVNIGRLTGQGAVTTDGGILTVGQTGIDFAFSGSISGAGGLTKDSTGVFTLQGVSTYTGATSITGGTLRLGAGGSLSSATDVSVSSGATFDLNGISDTVDSISGAGTVLLGGATLTVDEAAVTRTFSGSIQETGTLSKAGSGTLALTGSNSASTLQITGGVVQVNSATALGFGTTTIGAGTLQATASLTNATPVTLTSASSTINVNNGATMAQSGIMSGAGALNKHGLGTLALGAANTYTGNTNIINGAVRLNNSNRISDASDLSLAIGATLQMQGFSETVASVSGTGGTVDTGAGGRLTVTAPSGTFTFGGVFTGSGGLNKQGAHTLTLSGSSTNSGATNITGGILRLAPGGGLGNDSDVTVTGATWDLDGTSDAVDSILGSGSILLGGATLTVDEGGSATRTFSGAISEAGNLVKTGSHTLVLSGNNSYTGTTTLGGGRLEVANSANLGAGELIFSNGTIATTGSFTNARPVSFAASQGGAIDVASGTTLTQSGALTSNSLSNLILTGGGTFQLTSANSGTFAGDITVLDGVFDMAGAGNALGNSTSVIVISPAVFLVNNAEDIGNLGGSGSVVLNQELNVGFDNASESFAGVISGAAQLGKRGTGMLSLSGVNTYTGPTDINSGILQLTNSGQLSDQTDVDVAAGATFSVNNISDAIDSLTGAGAVIVGVGAANTLTVGSNGGGGTFSGSISGTGRLAKTGAGMLILSGNNTYASTTSFNGGILSTASNTNLGAGQLNFNGGTWEATGSFANARGVVVTPGSSGTIDVNAGAVLTQTGALTALSATLNKTDAGSLVLNVATAPAAMNINGGLLQFAAAGSLGNVTDVTIAAPAVWDLNGLSDTIDSISGGGNILLGGATLTVDQDEGGTTFSGVISEAGNLVKTGTHTLALTNNNTYVGNTAINGGTLAINSDGSLGNLANGLSFDGGTLEITSATTSARAISLNSGGGVVAITGGLNVSTLSGNITGPGSLTKAGAPIGGLILTGNNSYSGGTFVTTGALTVATNANLGANSGAVSLQNGSRLNATGSFVNQHALVLDNGGDVTVGTGFTLTQAVGISGTGTLVKNGAGTLLLTAPATHAGDTVINAGTLQFGSGALPDLFDVTVAGPGDVWDLNGVSDAVDGLFGGGTVLLGGGTLTVGASGGGGDFSGSIQEAGAFIKTGAGVQILSGANSYTASTTIDEGVLQITDNNSLGALSASLTFNNGTLRTTTTFATGRTTTITSLGTFDVAPATTLTFDSPIGGAGHLAKIGDGVLRLTQPNTYAGATNIQTGALRLTGAGQLADSTDVDVALGAVFDMTNLNDAIDALTGAGSVELGTGTLTIGASGGGGTFSGVISGTGLGGAVVKNGAGTAVFSGDNAYAGGTTINGGVLEVGQDVNLGAAGGQVAFNGGTLRTTGDITTVREMSIAAAGGIFEVVGGTTLDAGGNIAGAGALTKIGAGTLELGGISSYGGTNILDGLLSASFDFNLGGPGPLFIDGGTLRTTNIFVTQRTTTIGAGGASFDVDALTTHTHNGVIQGNAGVAGFVKIGGGAMRLTGVNTFTAPLHLDDGRLEIALSNQLGNASNVIHFGGGALGVLGTFSNARSMRLNAGGGTIDVNAATTLTQSGVISDGPGGPAGPLTKSGPGTLLLTAANTFSSPVNVEGGVLRLSGGGRLPDTADVDVTMPAALDLNGISDAIDALSGDGDMLLGAGTLTIGASGGGGTFGGTISGAGGLIKAGAGTQLLRTKTDGMTKVLSTYLGGTAFNGGVLDVEEDGNLGAASGPLSFNGGTLQAQSDHALATNRAVTLNVGGGTISTVGQDASVNIAGVIAGSGSLTKTGIGSLTLSSPNVYTGDTIINGGLVSLQGAGRLPDASTVSVNVATGGGPPQGLQLNNISDAINGLNGNGLITLGSGTLTVGAAGGGGSFGGSIVGTGGLTKVGAGVQTLAGPKTYSGGTAINGGVLEIANNNSLGAAPSALSFGGGTLRTTASTTIGRATTLNAGGGTFDVAAGTTLSHTAQIGGVGGLAKTGPGVLAISTVGVFGGNTVISDGTLRIVGDERLPNSTNVTVNGTGVLDLNNDSNETINGLSGSGAVNLGEAQLTVGIAGGGGLFTGIISGQGDFQKEGPGVQTLTGQHAYTGATVVNGGELILNAGGSIDQTTLSVGFNNGSDGAVTVAGSTTSWSLTGNLRVGVGGAGEMNINNGAMVTVGGQVAIGAGAVAGVITLDGGMLDNAAGTGVLVVNGQLGGKGTIVGNVVNQDVVAPGTSPGVLNVTGAYVQETAGRFVAEVGGAAAGQFDQLAVGGTASLNGLLEIGLANFTPAPADVFPLLTAGSLLGSFSNIVNGARLNVTAGGAGSFQVNYGPGSPFGANMVVLSDFIGAGASFTADFDGDNDVDGDDFAQWTGDFGVNDDSDADNDGDSDGADFLAWQRQLGSGLPAVASAGAVPEPSSLILAATLTASATALRRRKPVAPQ